MKALIEKARELGADLAGVASIGDLGAGDVRWPEGAKSIVVVALAHPPDKPEMDWWFGRSDPPGNRRLAGIVQGLCDWIPARFGFSVAHLPYHVDRGGAYLKDAAVLAGLGCIGLNNLLVTPDFGPRVRLRALTIDAPVPPTGPIAFDPCRGCDGCAGRDAVRGDDAGGGHAQPLGAFEQGRTGLTASSIARRRFRVTPVRPRRTPVAARPRRGRWRRRWTG